MPAKADSGLVLGKFMPLHRGHEALLSFAQEQVKRLYVVVDHPPNELISGTQRCRWIEQTVPGATVLYLPRAMPQEPSETPQFWDIWRSELLALLPEAPQLFIASETYGEILAPLLGARFVPHDIARAGVPISATQIRQNLWEHWDQLGHAAKPDLVMRVCVFGTESTGKTTLAKALAEHFDTVWVREFARQWIEQHGDPTPKDMMSIAQGQLALQQRAHGNRVVFSDTDVLSTAMWQRWLFGEASAELDALARANTQDLYLLCAPDLPWVADAVRYFPQKGETFFAECEAQLQALGRPYAIVRGQGNDRLQRAIVAVEAMAKPFFSRIFA